MLISVFLQDDIDKDLDVNNDMANRMSLFYAHATPMLRMLSDNTTKFVSQVSLICVHACMNASMHTCVRAYQIIYANACNKV